jgi:hypothetical protein
VYNISLEPLNPNSLEYTADNKLCLFSNNFCVQFFPICSRPTKPVALSRPLSKAANPSKNLALTCSPNALMRPVHSMSAPCGTDTRKRKIVNPHTNNPQIMDAKFKAGGAVSLKRSSSYA